MINFKQKQLIDELVSYVTGKFPEVTFIDITESPEDPESLWIRVTSPNDDVRRSELMDYACDKSMDILEDYGYHMLVMPTRKQTELAV